MRKWKRHVSEFLVLAMLLSQLPLSSRAAEAVDQETESQQAQGRQVTAEEIEGVSLIDNEAISRDEMKALIAAHGGRNTGQEDLSPQDHLFFYDHRFFPVAELKRKQLVPEYQDYGQNSAQLDDHQKKTDKIRRSFQLYKSIQQDHMACTAHRQPFRDPFYNSK